MANRLFHSVKSETLVDANEYAYQPLKIGAGGLAFRFSGARHISVKNEVPELIPSF
jgi:hypothetical protein